MKSKRKKVKKRVENRRKISRSVVIIISALILVVALIIGAILITKNGSFETESGLGSSIDTYDLNLKQPSNKLKFDYPISIVDKDILDVQLLGKSTCILTKTSLVCLDSDNYLSFTSPLKYSLSQMYTCGEYGLVYDKYSGKFTLFNDEGIILQSKTETEKEILLAKVTEQGYVVVVTTSETKSSAVNVYDTTGKLIYRWICADEFVVTLSVSQSRYIVCGAIGSKDGKYFSKVYTLDTNYDDVLSELDVLDKTIVNVEFIDENEFSLLTNKSRLIYNFETLEKKISEVVFENTLLNFANCIDGSIAICEEEIDDLNTTNISLYNENNELLYKYQLPKKVNDIYVDKKAVYALTLDNIVIINEMGEYEKDIEISDSEFGIVGDGVDIYHYSVGIVHKNEYKLFTW